MTGEGDPTVTSTSPTGRAGEIVSGPVPHTQSSYERAGDEWGTSLLFDEPGCSRVHLTRTDSEGDVWLAVAA